MLHELVMPAYRPQLEAILDFQQQLLAFACQTPALPLTVDILKKSFGEQKGQWISERCRKGSTTSDFYKELAALINHVAQYPAEGSEIVAAFRHDRDFYLHRDDPDFQFSYPDLSPDAKKAIKPLMVSFYEKLLPAGFPDYIHLCGAEKFTHKTLLKEFYEANAELSVCPGCDGTRPFISNKTFGIDTRDDYRDEGEVDHFFPKSFYPFFSVHFMNLVPICGNCNQKAKGYQDPLSKNTGKGVLLHTFLPFCRPAVRYIDITIFSNATNVPKVAIRNRPGLATVEQVENLNRIFKLNTRWEFYLQNWIEVYVQKIKVQARKRDNRQRIERAIKSELSPFARMPEVNVGKMTNLLVQRGYARYVLSNRQEMELLIDQIMDDNAPKRRRF